MKETHEEKLDRIFGRKRREKPSPKPPGRKERDAEIIRLYFEEELSARQVAERTGANERHITTLVSREKEARARAEAALTEEKEKRLESELVSDELKAMFAKSKQSLMEAAIRAHIKKLDREYSYRLQQGIEKFVREHTLPSWERQKKDYDTLIKKRKGVFTKDEYNLLLKCLHPDMTPSPERKAEAFRLLDENKLALLPEKEHPTNYEPLPRTVEELMRRKAALDAERRAARARKATV